MKRFMIVAMTAGVCLAMLSASSDAQEKKTQYPPIDRIKFGHKYAVPDLAVIDMSGAFDGTNFNVGGTVKNVGHGAYSRTRSASGAFEGRQILLYASGLGGAPKLLRTLSVPSLKVNETWSTGSIKISPREYAGTGNPSFVLRLTQGDANRDNDSKQISVSFVR